MQINNNSLNLSAAIGQTPAIDQNKSSLARTARSSDGDTVELSGFSAQLAADPQKLDQLRAAYQSGAYNISPAQIASSLIQETLQPS